MRPNGLQSPIYSALRWDLPGLAPSYPARASSWNSPRLLESATVEDSEVTLRSFDELKRDYRHSNVWVVRFNDSVMFIEVA